MVHRTYRIADYLSTTERRHWISVGIRPLTLLGLALWPTVYPFVSHYKFDCFAAFLDSRATTEPRCLICAKSEEIAKVPKQGVMIATISTLRNKPYPKECYIHESAISVAAASSPWDILNENAVRS